MRAIKVFLKEEIEPVYEVEPTVPTLYAVYEKKFPTRVTILEIYADSAAYRAHIQTPQFLKYKDGTLKMVKSLDLVEVLLIVHRLKIN